VGALVSFLGNVDLATSDDHESCLGNRPSHVNCSNHSVP
jgi:hypothetical protein